MGFDRMGNQRTNSMGTILYIHEYGRTRFTPEYFVKNNSLHKNYRYSTYPYWYLGIDEIHKDQKYKKKI